MKMAGELKSALAMLSFDRIPPLPKTTKVTLVFLAIAIVVIWSNDKPKDLPLASKNQFWIVQSIDTTKYSRDLARQIANEPKFDIVINQQMEQIAQTGANYVAISTPYDEEFVPVLKRWVVAARSHGLKVWFRGNFSGWERWFGHKAIGRSEHFAKTENFILNHSELFEDGDIFTSCPECENGGPGDPRKNGDIKGFRKFLVDEYRLTQNAFATIKKRVASNYFSMNADVAKVVMDKSTTKGLGGLVAVDHYVVAPEKLAADLSALIQSSGASQIVLGEFGAPIPDLHGNLDQAQQAQFIHTALSDLIYVKPVVAVNYWVNVGGSTQLWTNAGVARAGVGVLKSFYKPTVVSGYVKNELGVPLENVKIYDGVTEVVSNKFGYFALPRPPDKTQILTFQADGYDQQQVSLDNPEQASEVSLKKGDENTFFSIAKSLLRLLHE